MISALELVHQVVPCRCYSPDKGFWKWVLSVFFPSPTLPPFHSLFSPSLFLSLSFPLSPSLPFFFPLFSVLFLFSCLSLAHLPSAPGLSFQQLSVIKYLDFLNCGDIEREQIHILLLFVRKRNTLNCFPIIDAFFFIS